MGYRKKSYKKKYAKKKYGTSRMNSRGGTRL